MKLEFSQQILEKSSDIKFNHKPFSGSRAERQTDKQTDRQMGGRADGHDEVNSRFSKFCERA